MATDALRQQDRRRQARINDPVMDETKASLKTTEFWAMVAFIAAILVATAISDSLGDVRAWTLVAAVAIGYMISRGLAKAGTTYVGGEDVFRSGNPVRATDDR